ncbi:hypothetical protein FS749_001495 [Ceratobasidium sp. UAMH 11750]|nr:hypothetical protein FS749_001495 [Ceratobasidium sp. UAMH 11750]
MTVRIWDAQTGDALLEPLRGHSDEVTCVAISSDGQRIVSGSRDRDRTVRIWDAHTGAELFKMRHGDWHTVTCVAVSSDGQRIVSGSDKTLHIWDALTGAPLLDPPHRFSNPVTCVSISHGDRYIISASSDNTVRILDMQSGSVFFEPFLLLSSTATSVSISSDTQQIVFGSNSSIVWVQNFPDGLRPLTFQDIFQNSSSSDISRYSRVMSVQLSMLCDQQGWVRGSSGELLLWIPPEYQRTRPDHSILAISTNPENHPVHFDLSRIKIGNDWANLVS